MAFNPHKVTRDFEAALCDYTGAPYAVAVNSCTMALTLAVAYHLRNTTPYLVRSAHEGDLRLRPGDVQWIDAETVAQPIVRPVRIEIPKRTYCSVPMAIVHAGGQPVFRDEDWCGAYQLKPLPVWDSARWLTGNHYRMLCERLASATGQMVCLSFHASKTLGLEQGGAILHDDEDADAWLRMARFDGRIEGVAPKDQENWLIGWHCYMNPSTAAQGILKLHSLPRHNRPLPNDPYPDLSQLEIFR